ncbi:MAG: hypothetical protein D6830_01470 [Ignavibacteria bacterium]|nr:MAG: hypothetical protein D6830_01470 [Ignavibacteria bacterium]
MAMSSYRGNGGGEHLTKGAGIPKEKLKYRLLHSTDKDLRYYLMKWIEKKKNIKPVVTHNWKIIPANFVEKGKKKDEQILFGSEK